MVYYLVSSAYSSEFVVWGLGFSIRGWGFTPVNTAQLLRLGAPVSADVSKEVVAAHQPD